MHGRMQACGVHTLIHAYVHTYFDTYTYTHIRVAMRMHVRVHIYTVANGVSNPFDVVKSRVQVTCNACMSLCTHACHACVHAVKSRVQVAHTPMRQRALETLTPLLRHVRHGYFIEPSSSLTLTPHMIKQCYSIIHSIGKASDTPLLRHHLR